MDWRGIWKYTLILVVIRAGGLIAIGFLMGLFEGASVKVNQGFFTVLYALGLIAISIIVIGKFVCKQDTNDIGNAGAVAGFTVSFFTILSNVTDNGDSRFISDAIIYSIALTGGVLVGRKQRQKNRVVDANITLMKKTKSA